MIKVIPNIYIGNKQIGDFEWMIKQSNYDDCLFIFNDNEEYHYTNRIGSGNAIIRYYNIYNKYINIPRSAGIPTGTLKFKGYKKLDEHNKKVIDDSIEEIKNIIIKYKYKKVYYSANDNNMLATSIFIVGNDVIEYITNSIHQLDNI
jgi:hypothetical protein